MLTIHRRAACIATLLIGLIASTGASALERGASMYRESINAPRIGSLFSRAKTSITSAARAILPSHSEVDEAARRNGIPVAVARAVMHVESGGDCRAKSSAGAIGVMQVLPGTAREVGVYGPLTECRNSAEAGNRYLAKIIGEYGVSCESMSLYERGIGARPVCTSYGRKVMAWL